MTQKINDKYTSNCPHVILIDKRLSEEFLSELCNQSTCSQCDLTENLWLCLRDGCLQIGCGNKKGKRHSTQHAEQECHPLMINLNTKCVWCEACSSEIKLITNNPPYRFQSESAIDNNLDYDVAQVTNKAMIQILDNDVFSRQKFTGVYDECNVKGVVGLLNIGNTCYLNSALQALSNCPALTNYFMECADYILTTTKEPKLSHSYLELIVKLWSSKKVSYVVPTDILQSIKCVNPMFKGYLQQDSQEFYLCLIEQLHEELKILNHDLGTNINDEETHNENLLSSGLIMKEPSSDTESYETCDTSNSSGGASESSNSSDSGIDSCLKTPLLNTHRELLPDMPSTRPKYYSSIISDLFNGKLISQVQCLKCESLSKTIETIQDLSLPIPTKEYIQSLQSRVMNRHSNANDSCVVSQTYQGWFAWLMSYLKNLTSWSDHVQIRLQDCLQAYFSEADLKGDNKYNCEKCKEYNDGVKYSKLSSLPEVLVIQFKRFKHDSLFSNKISTYVEFPFCNLDLKDHLHVDCSTDTTSSLYDLCAVICHHGTSSAGGHYTCYALNATNYEWYEYDDSTCVQVNEQTVASSQAYMLFYRKKNEKMDFVRNELRSLLGKNSKEMTNKPYYISKQWLNKFKHFAMPGEVSNQDFVCTHGDVYPHLWSSIDQLTVPVTQFVWDYLTQKFGIDKCSAQISHLQPCKICLLSQEVLKKRMLREKNAFAHLTHNFSHESSHSKYALSTNWFKKWTAFVNGKESDPPGRILNQSICICKNGTFLLNTKSNYQELNEEAWSFLFKIYGGGPVLPIRYAENASNLKQLSLNKTHSLNQLKLATPTSSPNTSPSLSPRVTKPQRQTNKLQTTLNTAESLMHVQETRI